jgi:hypothetical protein
MEKHNTVYYKVEISNTERLHDFFGMRQTDFYSGPYSVMAKLEARVSIKNVTEDVVTVPYKDEGDAIFILKEIKTPDKQMPTLVYEFDTTIS